MCCNNGARSSYKGHGLSHCITARRWMEKEYGHHVAASLPADSDTGMSAKKIMEEGNLPAFTLQDVSHSPTSTQVSLRLAATCVRQT